MFAIFAPEPPAPDELGLCISNCRGCLAAPLAACACCGKPATTCTMADAEGRCSVSWCDRCFDTLLGVRMNDRRFDLVSWPITEPRKATACGRGRHKREGQGVRKTSSKGSKRKTAAALPVTLTWPDVGGDAA